MKQYYRFGEAARKAGVTTETLRHYDRGGLGAPCYVDSWTGYRYYSDFEISKVQIVHYLRSIHFSLPTIKKLFSDADVSGAVDTLRLAQRRVDEEIEHLLHVKRHLQDTLDNYSSKRNTRDFVQPSDMPTVQDLPPRTIFLAQGLHAPTLDNLMKLYNTVEEQVSPELRPLFRFENAAGAFFQNSACTLFATCIRSAPHPNVRTLPGGRYLCASCTVQDYIQTMDRLRALAADQRQDETDLLVLDIVFTGIIQWEYEAKMYRGP